MRGKDVSGGHRLADVSLSSETQFINYAYTTYE